MNWIDIGEGIEIMERPVLNRELAKNDNHSNSPVRGINQQKAQDWAVAQGLRLPTEQEWLRGWPRMQHWGLLEWTSTVENGHAVVLGGSWNNVNSENFRVANRYWYVPDLKGFNVAFRCVREKK